MWLSEQLPKPHGAVMKKNTGISNLHCKFAEKRWNHTFQLVRRCMEKSRDESKPCEPLVRSLDRLQEELQAPTMNNMKSRLEMIAKQQGMGFHFTEATCYLTADFFYLEVLLLPSGEVQEVKVALHGEHPTPSRSLLHLLRSNNFSDFAMRLGELFAQYNIPGDNETKSNKLKSLQCLWKDLQQISDMPNEPKCFEAQMGLINSGRVGFLMAEKQDYPPSLYFYMSPNDCLKNSELSFEELLEFKPAVQAAQATIGVSDLTRKLQMTSLISEPPQLDTQNCPAVAAFSEVSNEMLPTCFLLRLKTPIPVLSHIVERVGQITGVTIPDCDLQWAPLPKLLIKASASEKSPSEPLDGQEIFSVVFPEGGMHTYVLPNSSWDVPTQRAALLASVPFTQPAHVSAVLELLRHQCAFNTLLRSCLTQSASPASVCDLHFEVRPEYTTSISVTFRQPHIDRLAVLLVNMPNPRQITCQLFGGGFYDLSSAILDEYISILLTKCMSIPVAMRALYSRLEKTTSCPTTAVAENDRLSPVMDTDGQSPAASQSAEHDGVPGSVRGAISASKSELHPDMTASMPDDPHPFVPVAPMANCQS
ncbi:mediator of RNA polymerase II transcription subunit 1 isoform X1 [Gambusia affinis]|uniref:mediator of RNA polymerase II transcription subunit 1 isoform X1 n=4 Tax=Gambusia affinis TaxID=33528 RepID=UPI001CDB7594|nr:mediator of RNA polymerase II transcription subunit 1 isoform X1 [Gambusia affinis]